MPAQAELAPIYVVLRQALLFYNTTHSIKLFEHMVFSYIVRVS